MGVGLTDFISKSDVRQRIGTEYPNPGENPSGEIAVEHGEHEDTSLGKALELLMLLWLDANAESVHAPYFGGNRNRLHWHEDHEGKELEWAQIAAATRPHNPYPAHHSEHDEWGEVEQLTPEEEEMKEEAFERAESQHRQFRQTGMNIDAAVDAALIYSGINWHAGLHDGSLDSNSAEAEIIEELRDLFGLFREHHRFPGEEVVLIPDFGIRSHILSGRGDFITDGLLVDVKTTAKPRFKVQYWRQLLAYYILNDIHRELVKERSEMPGLYHPELSEVGIYFARFGELQTVDMESYLTPREEYERFRAWFVDRAIEANHDKRKDYAPVREALTEPYDYEQQSELSDFF
jgi:hypothetical protein